MTQKMRTCFSIDKESVSKMDNDDKTVSKLLHLNCTSRLVEWILYLHTLQCLKDIPLIYNLRAININIAI